MKDARVETPLREAWVVLRAGAWYRMYTGFVRWVGVLVLLIGLVSCQPAAPKACVVIRAVSVEAGFKVGNTDSPDVTIQRGDCIEFVNADPSSSHTVQTKPFSNPPEEIPATNLPYEPNRFKKVFNIAGEYEYICSLSTNNVAHARTMYGKITVR